MEAVIDNCIGACGFWLIRPLGGGSFTWEALLGFMVSEQTNRL